MIRLSSTLCNWLKAMLTMAAVGALALLVWEIGWPLEPGQRQSLRQAIFGLVLTFVAIEVVLMLNKNETWAERRRGWAVVVLGGLALLEILFEEQVRELLQPLFSPMQAALLALFAVVATVLLSVFVRGFDLLHAPWLRRLPPGVLAIAAFISVILVGSLLLMTPNATPEGIRYVDALFTSTSAVCITGLVVVDTAVDFTRTGQFIILGLIQLGGFGIMTLAYFLALIAGQGITLRDRVFLRDMLSQDNLTLVARFIRSIVVMTLVIELAGAIALYYAWKPGYPHPERLAWDALFHSVSAFCNAGFSTYSNGLEDAASALHRPVQVIMMILIVLGGLGFAVLAELTGKVRNIQIPGWHAGRRGVGRTRRFSIHTKLVLVTTAVLVVGGTGLILISEMWQPAELERQSFGDKVWEAVFFSVAARTAGFSIVDMSGYMAPAVLIFFVLMIIGGSPGGTAGGVKTTTAAISVLELLRILRGRSDIQVWDRRLDREVVERCLATVVLAVLWMTTVVFLMVLWQPGFDFLDVVFEAVSAFATAGLSRGITPELSDGSKVLVTLTMLVGRIGILAFAFAIAGKARPLHYQLPPARLPLN